MKKNITVPIAIKLDQTTTGEYKISLEQTLRSYRVAMERTIERIICELTEEDLLAYRLVLRVKKGYDVGEIDWLEEESR